MTRRSEREIANPFGAQNHPLPAIVHTFSLSWPVKQLSSNYRGHWAPKTKAVQAYRAEAWGRCGIKHPKGQDGWKLEFRFCPPDKRRRDCHNMPAMMKAAIDGISDALGVDDSTFTCTFPSQFEEPVKGGRVHVRLTLREVQEV